MNKDEEKDNELKSIFYIFNRKVSSIDDFLDQSKWVIEDFIQHLSEDRVDNETKELYSVNFDEWYKSSMEFLPNFLYQSALLLAWSCFIELLRKILISLGLNDSIVDYKLRNKPKNTPDYLLLLNEIENLGFVVNFSKQIMRF